MRGETLITMGVFVLCIVWLGVGAHCARKAVKTYWGPIWGSRAVSHSEKIYGLFEVTAWLMMAPVLLLVVWVVKEE
jgi:hypothetical protein